MLNWIGGVLGISGDAKSVTGSTPFIFRDKKTNDHKKKQHDYTPTQMRAWNPGYLEATLKSRSLLQKKTCI